MDLEVAIIPFSKKWNTKYRELILHNAARGRETSNM